MKIELGPLVAFGGVIMEDTYNFISYFICQIIYVCMLVLFKIKSLGHLIFLQKTVHCATFICVYIFTYRSMYIYWYMYICMYLYVCMYICICIYMYVLFFNSKKVLQSLLWMCFIISHVLVRKCLCNLWKSFLV